MLRNEPGPKNEVSKDTHATKYRLDGESFEEAMYRIANALKDNDDHYHQFKDILLDMRFMPGGRVQAAMGAPRITTAYNCFVSGVLEDSMDSIMDRAKDAAETMRRGGGIGYDFSRIRPKGDRIKTLGSRSSGPVSFMGIFDAICQTIASAGHRRGAQMGVLRVDHPDIKEFILAKHNSDKLTGFNISVGVTDEFMQCLTEGKQFPLRFEGEIYEWVDPNQLWELIMRSTWDWAEPGVLFIDRINEMNNLWYCETIEATNPCGEQPLPPYGACLLGSFNLVKYIKKDVIGFNIFDFDRFKKDIKVVVRAQDNIIDRTIYPLSEQEKEAKAKRRMGLGVTGVANALEAMGLKFGTTEYIASQDQILRVLTNECYRVSAELAFEKGAFPLFDRDRYLAGNFIKKLDLDVQEMIRRVGIRNSHLTSIAPTGTISLCADNVSSGIEPPFMLEYDRIIQTFDGPFTVRMYDYGYKEFGVKGRTANECSAAEHVRVLAGAQRWIDSAVSKTCNVGDDVSYEDFKKLYIMGWELGCKGLTTFRAAGKRFGILNAPTEEKTEEPSSAATTAKAEACTFDPATGTRTCDA